MSDNSYRCRSFGDWCSIISGGNTSEFSPSLLSVKVLPIFSNPWAKDSDFDGIDDKEDNQRLRCNIWFNYNREEAINYAFEWAYGINEDFYYYSNSDCQNFVSQCLFAGGFPMDNEWYSYKSDDYRLPSGLLKGYQWVFSFVTQRGDSYKYNYEWDISTAWDGVVEYYQYLVDTGYAKDFVVIDCTTDLTEFIEKYGIKVGDPMLFDENNDGEPNHATIINRIENGIIYYAAHTNPRHDEEIYSYFDNDKTNKAIICILNDRVIVK